MVHLAELFVGQKCLLEWGKDITAHIAEYIARDLRPISTINGRGFHQLLHYIELGYEVPSKPFLLPHASRLAPPCEPFGYGPTNFFSSSH